MTLQLFKSVQALITISVFLMFLFSSSSASAQTPPCGNIVYFDHSEPITDCQNPFMVATPGQETVVIMNEEVTEGETIFASSTGVEYYYPIISSNDFYRDTYFRHDGDNLVEVDSEYREITLEDYRRIGLEYFGDAAIAEPYAQYQMGEAIDTDSPTWDWDAYTAYNDLCQLRFRGWRTALTPGTYTAVFNLMAVSVYNTPTVPESWLQKMWSYIIPTAHAQFATAAGGTVTFTIAEEVVEPTGASSVLFLPGIQASRLYAERDSGSEDRLWEPNVDADVQYLEMTESGESVNDIYTRDVLDEIAFPLFGQNIYKGFLGMLEELVNDEVINGYEAFAYDWRYSVEDVVLNGTRYENEVHSVIAKVEELAEDSYSGKVTVIGHSNGGLVAKILISELERQGKTDLVDKVVFIGTPQLGTPKAIGVMLHGLQQQKAFGLVVDDMTARDAVRNMPGVYGLLPSPRYFDVSGDVLVTSDNTQSTANIREYGDIDSYEKLVAFLLDANNVRADEVSIHTPGTLNSNIINDTALLREDLDNWRAPDTVDVYEIVGTGLATIKGFEYKQFPCVSAICAFGSYSKPYPLLTNAGDETVVELSADAYAGSKVKGVVNLKEEGDGVLSFDREHADMTESPTVQSFVDSIIRFPYLNETIEVPQQFIDVGTYTMIGSHSPVEISLETIDGDRVGVFDGLLYEEVPGSQYFELGGSSYIVIPKEVEYEVTIKGTDTGVYSLTIDTLDEADIQSNEFTYLGATTTPQMLSVFSASSTGFSTIQTDQDGDGVFDKEETLSGDLVEVVYTFDSLISEIKLLELKRIYKNILLIQAKLAEHQMERGKTRLASVTLYNLERTLKLYKAKRLISAEKLELLVQIITQLKK